MGNYSVYIFIFVLNQRYNFLQIQNGEKNGQDLGSKGNDHFKVGLYKSLEREKEDEKNVEESEETDEEKKHTDENEDDIRKRNWHRAQKRKVVLVTKKKKPEEDYVT